MSCICEYIFLALLSESCTVLICPPFVLYLRLHFLSFVNRYHALFSYVRPFVLYLRLHFLSFVIGIIALFSYVRPLSCTCDYIFLALLIGIMHCSHCYICDYIFLALLSVSCTVLICPLSDYIFLAGIIVLYPCDLRLHFLSFVNRYHALFSYVRPLSCTSDYIFLALLFGIMHCSPMSAHCLVFASTFS